MAHTLDVFWFVQLWQYIALTTWCMNCATEPIITKGHLAAAEEEEDRGA